MKNIFSQYPIIIERLHTKQRIIFAQESIADAIRSESEAKLKKFYGSDWQEKLGIKSARGSAENLIDITESTVQVPKDTSSQIVVSNITIFPEDNIAEFKQKIYLALGADVFTQHIYAIAHDTIVPLYYRITTDNIVPIDINKSKQNILGLPVDIDMYQTRDIVQIEALDEFMTMGEFYAQYGVRYFYLALLSDFIGDSTLHQLDELSRSDIYQFSLIYWGFIAKFWPMFGTQEVFQAWVQRTNIREVYPELFLAVGRDKRYELEGKILNKKYELLEDPPENFKKYILDAPAHLLEVAIKNATLSILPDKSIQINVRNLFEKLHASAEIPFIRVHLREQSLVLTRIKSPNPVEGDANDIQRIYEKIKYRIQLPLPNTILLVIPTKYENYTGLFLILTIRENGKYLIHSSWEEEIQINFAIMFSIMQKTINPIIDKINALDRGIFDGIIRLPQISKINTEFSELGLNLFWKVPINQKAFAALEDILKNDTSSGIIRTAEQASSIGIYYYQFMKGISNYSIQSIEQLQYTNQYEHLINAKFKQKWEQLFEFGRPLIFNYRTTDVKIEIQNIREKEFLYIYYYIAYIFYRLQQTAPTAKVNEKVSSEKQNLLKLLKSKDPELYVFKQFGSDVVFSRICQRDHQPIAYTQDEYANLDTATRDKTTQYWNFTTNSPMWYVCPNAKYPYLSFIVGQHPRDYCLPCCKKTPSIEYEVKKKSKKTPAEDKSVTKRDYIYNTCMLYHNYTEEDTYDEPSRYIMNYGKVINIGRIGHLPDIFGRYLLYNIIDKTILYEEQVPKIFEHDGKQYDIPALLKVVKHSKVKDMKIELISNMLTLPNLMNIKNITVLDVLKRPALSPNDMNRINNADLSRPVLLLREEHGALTLIEGIYRIAKAQFLGNSDIKVKVITQVQLDKARIDESNASAVAVSLSNTTNLMKQPNYYLLGVPQNNINVLNIGAGYAIASAIGLTFYEFIEKIIIWLEKNNVFHQLFQGRLPMYFIHMNDLQLHMHKLFMQEGIDYSDLIRPIKFTKWNELFIELTQLCFAKIVLILDDTSVNISGTSATSMQVVEGMDIILPSHYVNINDIIPLTSDVKSSTTLEYILLLRKKKKSKLLFNTNHTYYPIFIFTPKTFFKSLHIDKKIYTNSDEIIKLLRDLLISAAVETSTSTEKIDLNMLEQFLVTSKNVKLGRYFINTLQLCYAVELLFNNKSIILPIRYEPLHLSVPAGNYSRSEITADFADLKAVIRQINEFIVTKSEESARYQISPVQSKYKSVLNQREMRVNPMWELIKVEKFLLLAGQIIGFICGGLYYYFQPTAHTNAKYAALILSAITNYSILTENFTKQSERVSIFELYHDPDIINAVLLAQHERAPAHAEVEKKGREKKSRKKINNIVRTNAREDNHGLFVALYERFLYNIFVVELITELDSERNMSVRKKISAAIDATNFRNTDSVEKFYAAIMDLTNEKAIVDFIAQMLLDGFDKRDIRAAIDARIYSFDKETLNKWRKQSEDYATKSADERAHIHAELVKNIIAEVNSGNFHIGSMNEIISKDIDPSAQFPNIFVPCSLEHDGAYCKGKKLMIPRDKLPILADILAAEFCNPYKREYLLDSILTSNIRDYFKFTQLPGEELYVKLQK